MKTGRTSIIVAILACGLQSNEALACGTPDDAKQFRRDLKERARCEVKKAMGRPLLCERPDAVCAADIDELFDVIQNASTEKSCQRELYRQPISFATKRLRELSQGKRAASRATRFVSRIEKRCLNQALSFGGPCSIYSTPKQGALCLRALTEALVQKATGTAIKPNFLLILTDDQRWDTLWAMPLLQEHVTDRGIHFTNSFTSTSLCCPDRASIFTGLYAHNHGVTSNAGALLFDHDGDTIQRRLKEHAGYRTALVGKYMLNTSQAVGANAPPGWDQWHVFLSSGGAGSPFGLYYDYTLSTNGLVHQYAPLDSNGTPTNRYQYSTDLLRGRTIGLIKKWKNEPFFIEYAPFAPHPRAIAPDRHSGIFSTIEPARPPSHMEGDLSQKPSWVLRNAHLIASGWNQPAATDQRRIEMLETLPAVDEISSQLEVAGLTDNTMLIFTSDNGYMYLEHWLTLKSYPYEESIRVPLIIRYPARYPTSRSLSEFVQSIDFYPTMTQLAGIQGAAVNGTSLIPLLDETATAWRQEILIEHFGVAGAAPSTGIRTHDWKLIRTDAPEGITLELYNMRTDQFELDNVAAHPENATLVTELQGRLNLLEQQ